jgi:hypothetical protein
MAFEPLISLVYINNRLQIRSLGGGVALKALGAVL